MDDLIPTLRHIFGQENVFIMDDTFPPDYAISDVVRIYCAYLNQLSADGDTLYRPEDAATTVLGHTDFDGDYNERRLMVIRVDFHDDGGPSDLICLFEGETNTTKLRAWNPRLIISLFEGVSIVYLAPGLTMLDGFLTGDFMRYVS